jgi:hypothetical protein
LKKHKASKSNTHPKNAENDRSLKSLANKLKGLTGCGKADVKDAQVKRTQKGKNHEEDEPKVSEPTETGRKSEHEEEPRVSKAKATCGKKKETESEEDDEKEAASSKPEVEAEKNKVESDGEDEPKASSAKAAD